MIDPTTNQSAAVADSFAVWDPEVGGYVDLRTSITGNAPAGLKTIQQLAGAINNDPVFAVSVDSATADLAADIATKAPIANPTFTGTVQGVSKSHVGLSDVDNTSDAAKPVSEATQIELNKKAPKANPVFTGTVEGVSKTHVGLGNVDNTSDANKPVSEATQTELNKRAPLLNPVFTQDISVSGASALGDVRIGSIEQQTAGVNKSLTVWGSSILKGGITGSGTLSVVGQTDLYDDTRHDVDWWWRIIA